jgi:NADH-quinone oxidoreductase subunit N
VTADVTYLELLKLGGSEVLLVVAGLAVLLVDIGVMRDEPLRNRMLIAGAITTVGCFAAALWALQGGISGRVFAGMLVIDRASQLVKVILLLMTVATTALSVQARFTRHVGEYFTLLLFSTVGMMLMVSTENILLLFIALEIASLSLYILTAFNEENPQADEAAMKYFLFGGVAAAFLLFGLSLLYGLTDSLDLREIGSALGQRGMDAGVAAAVALVLVGFGFKVAAVPFHLWAPDAYVGAPTPVAALVASGSKVAAFFLLGKVLVTGFAEVAGSADWQGLLSGWAPVLAAMACFSLLLGNLAAIAQKRLKRLLAYSAVGHAGYMLVGALALTGSADSGRAFAMLMFYAATYGFTTIGAFGVAAAMERAGESDRIEQFAGLSSRAPLLSFCLMIFLLSLAGIPPLVGFASKFFLFAAALGAGPGFGLVWLVGFAIAMSAVALYYYLGVLKQAYVAPADETAGAVTPQISVILTLAVLAAIVLLLGLYPGLLLDPLTQALAATAGG